MRRGGVVTPAEKTVDQCVAEGVAESQAILDRYNEINAKLCEPLELPR